MDRLSEGVNADLVRITNAFDVLNRLTKRGLPDIASSVESFGYSTRAVSRYTNQLGKITSYFHDAYRRLVYETNANLHVNQFRYDESNMLTNLIDRGTNYTDWEFDTFGRMTSKINDSNVVVQTNGYNANGWITARWTPAKGVTTYGYDALGNLTNVNYPSSSDITNRYDAVNRLVTNICGELQTVFTYSASGDLLSEDGPWENDTVYYSYNNRRRTGLTLLQPNGAAFTQTNSYDAGGRLTNLISTAGSFDYSYDPAHPLRVQKITLPNSAFITNAYDAAARLTDTWLKDSSATILNRHSYQYNQAHQRTNHTRWDGSSIAYTYDDIGQLKTAKAKHGTTNRLNEQFSYVYHAAGNLFWRTNNQLRQNIGVNGLNELAGMDRSGTMTVRGTTTAAATNVVVSDGTTSGNASLYADRTFALAGFTVSSGSKTYTATASDSYGRTSSKDVTVTLPVVHFHYDQNSNLTNDEYRVFAYDDANQLISIFVTNSWKVEFVYDGLQRKRVQKDYEWRNGGV